MGDGWISIMEEKASIVSIIIIDIHGIASVERSTTNNNSISQQHRNSIINTIHHHRNIQRNASTCAKKKEVASGPSRTRPKPRTNYSINSNINHNSLNPYRHPALWQSCPILPTTRPKSSLNRAGQRKIFRLD